jgi:acyl carrier protein
MAREVSREAVMKVVVDVLRDVLSEEGGSETGDIAVNDETRLFGRTGLLDSHGLVSLIVGVEERLFDDFDVSIAIADEKAMSMAKSPFRTVGILVDHTMTRLAEQSVDA